MSSSQEQNQYNQIRRKVLERDSWRCQLCGSMQDLHVHHQTFRSHGGADCIDNLVTLCSGCHFKLHNNIASLR
jgi:ATP-dependent DNA helicase RecQ